MIEDFYNFITETTKNNFLNSYNTIVMHSEYNPYSEDLDIMLDLLDNKKFQKVIDYNNINILLSPKAHLFKKYAFEKLGKEKDAKSELIFAQKIIEGISLTGDGSVSSPYIVTRVSDEKDFLNHLQEKINRQRLIIKNGRYFDLIKCQSGNEIYFDITKAYLRLRKLRHI